MKNIDDLLDACKKQSSSDNRTGILLGIQNQLIGNWRARRSMPTNKHILKMCKLWSINLEDAINAVEYSREFERPMKQAGFMAIELMGGISAMTLLGMSLPLACPNIYAALGVGTLYIM